MPFGRSPSGRRLAAGADGSSCWDEQRVGFLPVRALARALRGLGSFSPIKVMCVRVVGGRQAAWAHRPFQRGPDFSWFAEHRT